MPQPIPAIIPALPANPALPAAAAPDPAARQASFENWFSREISTANQQLLEGDRQVTRLAVGEVGNLHQVMLELEKARLSFSLVAQVRNRLLEGYQEVMRMQI
jgi:flagellar hook-basal body complex protein FliE